MGEAVQYWSQSFDGRAECVADARRFVLKTLGDVPGVELVVLVVSELATNAVQHSDSGGPGGKFTLHLAISRVRWQVRMEDAGGQKEPRVQETHVGEDEAGRGLALVAALSSRWGVIGDCYARSVWAEILRPGTEHAMADTIMSMAR